MKTSYLIAVLTTLWLLPGLGHTEIYKWIDAQGLTHYSEDKPETTPAQDISEQLEDTVNFIDFNKPVAIDYYRPKIKRRPARVKINIELIDYTLAPAARQRIQSQVKNIYQAYHRWFGWDAQPARPITIKIFGDFTTFETYQRGEDIAHVTSRSHYSPRRREVVMLGTEFSAATLQVLFHEASHAIMHMGLMATPNWINEGLAETFETIGRRNGRIGVGINRAWAEIVQQQLREGSLRSFKDYLSISNRQWRGESARVERSYYMVSWSMMRFLLSTPQGIKTLSKVMAACKKQPWWQQDRLAGLFATSYPGGINKLNRDWRQWIKGLKA